MAALIRRVSGPLAGLIVLAVAPLITTDSYLLNVAIMAMIFAGLCVSWNMVSGYTGVFTFGHEAFFGVGGYTSALLVMHFGLSPWLTIWAGAAAGVVANALIFAPVRKLREPAYVAIVTLIFAAVLELIATNLTTLTGGPSGLAAIPALSPIGGIQFLLSDLRPFYYAALVLLLVVVGVCAWMLYGTRGLTLKAIRDAETSAESLGVNVGMRKFAVTSVAAGLAGLVGGFYAHYIQLLSPSSTLDIQLMIEIVAMTIIGGMGTFYGPVIGAFVVTFGLEYLRSLGSYQLLIYGALIIAVVLVAPGGITGGTAKIGHWLGRSRRGAESASGGSGLERRENFERSGIDT